MKLITAFLLSLVPVALQHNANVQEYGNLCPSDERAMLDNFATVLKNDEKKIAYIIVFVGQHSCGDEALYRGKRAKDWVVKQGIKSDRLIVKDGGYRPQVQTLLVVADKGEETPEFESSFDKKS